MKTYTFNSVTGGRAEYSSDTSGDPYSLPPTDIYKIGNIVHFVTPVVHWQIDVTVDDVIIDATTYMHPSGITSTNLDRTLNALFFDDNSSSVGTGASSLVPTAVKTSAYTAAASDFIPVDTTSGNVIVTLPATPADKTVIGVKHIIQGGTNTVSIATGGTDVFNKAGGSTSLTLTLLNQGALLQYNALLGIWYVTADDLPLSQLDLRFSPFSEAATRAANDATLQDNIDAVSNGVGNVSDPTSSPLAGVNTYNVSAAGTYTNFSGVVVSSGDLTAGYVQLRKISGTWTKFTLAASSLPTNVFLKQHNLIWVTTAALSVTWSASGNDVVVSIPGGFIITAGNTSNFIVTPAYSGTITHLKALVLDLTTLASPVWSANVTPSQANIKATENKFIFLYVAYGFPYSNVSGVSLSQLNIAALKAVPVANLTALAALSSTAITAAGNFGTVWNEQIDFNVLPISAAGKATITSIASNSVTFSMTAMFIVTGGLAGAGYNAIAALASTTLANTQCLYIDMSTPATPVWSSVVAPTQANLKNSFSRKLAIINFYGRLYSPIASLQTLLNDAYVVYNTPTPASATVYNHLKLKKTGTIGVDCDYNTISAAIAAITTNTATNQYILEVLAGTYDNEAGPNGFGIEMKDYVHIFGENENDVIIRGVEAPSGQESSYATIQKQATALVKNVTIHGYKNKYTLHIDVSAPSNRLSTYENITTHNYGGTFNYDVGIGIYGTQQVIFKNAKMLGDGVFAHNNSGAGGRQLDTGFILQMEGCTMKEFAFSDYMQYSPDRIILKGNNIKKLTLDGHSSVYDANTSNPLANRGYYPSFTQIEENGNTIDQVVYSGVALAMLGDKPKKFNNYNVMVYNIGASILTGYAFKTVIDVPVPNSYSNLNFIGHRRVTPWNGSGIFAGFSEEDIASTGSGQMLTGKTQSAYFVTTGGNVVYGDELELNSSGQVQKRASGTLIGWALATATTNGLLVVVLPGR